MADFKIDDAQFQQLIAQHILDSISEETREKLIRESLNFLMTPTQGVYGRQDGPSPLANAFRAEVVKVAGTVVERVVGTDAIRRIIERRIEEAVKTWVKSNDYDISQVVGDAIKNSLEVNLRGR